MGGKNTQYGGVSSHSPKVPKSTIDPCVFRRKGSFIVFENSFFHFHPLNSQFFDIFYIFYFRNSITHVTICGELIILPYLCSIISTGPFINYLESTLHSLVVLLPVYYFFVKKSFIICACFEFFKILQFWESLISHSKLRKIQKMVFKLQLEKNILKCHLFRLVLKK